MGEYRKIFGLDYSGQSGFQVVYAFFGDVKRQVCSCVFFGQDATFASQYL